MNAAFLIIFGILAGMLLLALIIRAFVSGKIWSIMKFAIIIVVILTLYWFIGMYVYELYMFIMPTKPKNKNMAVWDNVWYAILIVFLVLLCTVFIKSLKKTELQITLLYNSFVALIVLVMFTMMYYLYMYYERINEITGYVTLAAVVGTAIVLVIKHFGISFETVYPIFIIYSFICMIFLMTFFIFTFSLLSKTYDFLT